MRQCSIARRMASLAVAGGLTAGLIVLAAIAAPAGAACRSLEPLAAESLFTIWQQAVASGNPGRLAELYADDAVVIGPATGAPATTAPDHRRALGALAGLGPMRALKRTVATGCESIRDYGVMASAGRPDMRAAMLRYSRVYELRAGRWLITLEHVSHPAGAPSSIAAVHSYQVPRPVPAVAGYVKALPLRPSHDPIAGIIARSTVPPTVPAAIGDTGATLAPLGPAREIAMVPGSALQSGPQAAAQPTVAPPPAAQPRPSRKARLHWSHDLPGFRTTN